VNAAPVIAAATPQHLPGVLHSLEPTLNQFGYLAVFGLVLVEDFGVPVPGETVLILGAVYAGSGRLNIVLVALLGFLGAVLGDNIGFALGHFGGRRLVERYGRYIFLTPARLDHHPREVHRGPAPGERDHRRHDRNALGAVSVLQRDRRRPVGRSLDQHRLLLGQSHQYDLQRRDPVLHLPRDRLRRARGRVRVAPRDPGSTSAGRQRRLINAG
jgi:hypothetical protein